MKVTRPYKLVYLGNYVINAIVLIPLLVIYVMGIDAPKVQDWLEMGLAFWGLYTLLNLWSRAFIVTETYKGTRTLDHRTTVMLTLALVIVDALAIMYSFSTDFMYVRASAVMLGVWVLTAGYLLISGKLFRRNKYLAA